MLNFYDFVGLLQDFFAKIHFSTCTPFVSGRSYDVRRCRHFTLSNDFQSDCVSVNGADGDSILEGNFENIFFLLLGSIRTA